MIVLQFDVNYLHWGLLLRSLALHEPRKRVLADTVGLRSGQAAEVRATHPKVVVRETPATSWKPDRTRMANRKCLVLPDAGAWWRAGAGGTPSPPATASGAAPTAGPR